MKNGTINNNNEVHVLESDLEILREQINRVDEQLLQSLSYRIDIARRIGIYKMQRNMAIIQASRWQEVLESRIKMAGELGLNTGFIEKMYNLIHEESIGVQYKLLNGTPINHSS